MIGVSHFARGKGRGSNNMNVEGIRTAEQSVTSALEVAVATKKKYEEASLAYLQAQTNFQQVENKNVVHEPLQKAQFAVEAAQKEFTRAKHGYMLAEANRRRQVDEAIHAPITVGEPFLNVTLTGTPNVTVEALATQATPPFNNVNLEIESDVPIQFQVSNAANLFTDWNGNWVAESSLPNGGLKDAIPETDPKRLGWYTIQVPLDTSYINGLYVIHAYEVLPVSPDGPGGPSLLSTSPFGVYNGTPYGEGVIPTAAFPPTPTDIITKFYTSTVSLHKTPAGSLGDLLNRLTTFLTKQGA